MDELEHTHNRNYTHVHEGGNLPHEHDQKEDLDSQEITEELEEELDESNSELEDSNSEDINDLEELDEETPTEVVIVTPVTEDKKEKSTQKLRLGR